MCTEHPYPSSIPPLPQWCHGYNLIPFYGGHRWTIWTTFGYVCLAGQNLQKLFRPTKLISLLALSDKYWIEIGA